MTTLVFRLDTLVRAIPETIWLLRSSLGKLPKVGTDTNPDSKSTDKPGPRAPMNLGTVDAADLQLECLAYWAELAGVDMTNLGRVWRRPSGEIRGVLYNDCRPADRLSERLLALMGTPEWVAPQGMHEHLHSLLANQAKLWPTIGDLLHEAGADATTTANQPG